MTTRRTAAPSRDERGAVAIIVAISMVMLLVVTAMVLDFGLARLDRQRVKSATDSAVMAGLRSGDAGSDKLHTYLSVCGALEFLKANEGTLSGLPDGVCSSPDVDATCDPATPDDPATKALYEGSTTAGGVTSTVRIESPYDLDSVPFAEEDYPTLAGDPSNANGCDQVGVTIWQSRSPGLGSLATSADLSLRLRSVGRVYVGEGDVAPALLLLERTRCQVLTNGSSGPGNNSKIWVYGSGKTPASIHSDSDASDSGCGPGPNQQLLAGNKADGIIAFGSVTPTGSPGLISTYAALQNRATDVVSDGLSNIFGTDAVTETGLPGTKPPLDRRDRVGRLLVDQRYLPGVTSAVTAAYSEWKPTAKAGYATQLGCLPGNPAAKATYMAELTAALDSVYIDCPDSNGITLEATISAKKIYFHGRVKGGDLHMPEAQQVFIDNTDNSGARINASALTLSNGDTFCIGAASCSSYGVDTCDPGVTGNSAHGHLIVRRGKLSSSGGSLLRMCNTTVYMLGGQLGAGTAASPGGCLPVTPGTLPTTTPCPGASDPAGNGHIGLDGATDWTAPNQYGDMAALTVAQKEAAWGAGEDLALWDETYAVAPNFKMAGGTELNVSGVFMLPNAFPIVFSGGAVFDLRDAQFITRSFAVDGGAQLLMRVDPNNAIPLPELDRFTLIR